MTAPTDHIDTSTPTGLTEPTLDLDAMLDGLRNMRGGQDEDTDTSAAPEGEADGGVESEDDASTPPSEDEEPPAAAEHVTPPGMVEIAGQLLSVDEARGLVALNDRMKQDPELARRVGEAVGVTPTATTPPAEDELPAHIDEYDEAQVALYREQQAIKRSQDELRAELAQTKAQTAAQAEASRRQEIATTFQATFESFHQLHPQLSTEDVRAIADEAASLGLFDSMEKKAPTMRDAFQQALEVTAWGSEQYRTKLLSGGSVADNDKESDAAKRKQKQSALNGSSGSASRSQETKAPSTREEMIAAMLTEARNPNT